MTKCTITIKNDGGNIFFNLHNVTVMSFSRISRSNTLSVLKHISRKKQNNFIRGLVTGTGNGLHKAIGRSCCIKMWSSWLFKLEILCCLRWTYHEIFKEYQSGTFTSFKTCRKPSFSLVVILKQMSGISVLLAPLGIR